MNYVQFMSSIILCIFLGIQTVSHSQYYPPHPNNDYDYYDDQDHSASAFQPTQVEGSHFDRRNIEPQYRQHNHHQYYDPVSTGTSVSYFGTLNNAVPRKGDTTEGSQVRVAGSSEDVNSQEPSASLANYRIRYNNNNPPPPPPEPEYPPFPPRHFVQYPPPPQIAPPPTPTPPRIYPPRGRGIGIVVDDEWQMNIYFSEREKPNNGKKVVQFNNGNQRPRPSKVDQGRVSEFGGNPGRKLYDDEVEEPPYAIVVVIDNRPTEVCPNNSYLLYRPNGRCYKQGTGVSPCGPYMKFYEEDDNSIYGDCDCVIDSGIVARPLAYWKPHDRCYFLYHRGPCRYSEWLILDRDGYPHCASRSCPQGADDENELSQEFWFRHKGKCYKTGEYYATFCSVGQENWKVYFPYRKNEPQCMKEPPRRPTKDFSSAVIDLRCKPGYKKMQNGNCKRVARFDDYDNY